MHPFLKNDFYINWPALTPDHIEADISKALQEARSAVDAVAAQEAPLSYETTIAALDEGLEPLNRAWGLVSHLDSVCNSPELRAAHNQMLPKVSEFFSGIPLNAELWQTLKAYGESDAVAQLSATKQRYVHETMADFREAGADLPAEQKKRAAELQSLLAEKTQKYSENCLDATNAWEKIVTDASLLAGLPESAIAAAKQDAERKGHEKAWRFTLQAPSYIAVMTYAESEALRQEVWQAYAAIGRHEPHANQELVREILDLRHEFAQLVGQKNWADHVTARRMAASGQTALEFNQNVFHKVRSQFEAEAEQLRVFKHTTLNLQPSTLNLQPSPKPPLLQPWEVAYWAEKQRKAKYDFDEEALRPYFAIDQVIAGLFELAETLFGLRIEGASKIEHPTSNVQRPTSNAGEACGKNRDSSIEFERSTFDVQRSAPTEPTAWHPEVKFYKLFDAESGEMLGAFYADWHPRESKRGG
ncbi:MAG: M3 family metallopeptidase, partial [Opitutales bacterium]